MAKMAKKIQTDYTKGGHDISQTAIPYYQNTLTTLNNYIQNPYETIDTILDKYYRNTSEQSDFLRNYQRAMANTSANNFASTGGGYSSSGQRAYNDNQRYWNDAMARLHDQGVGSAANMQNAWYNQALQGAGAFQTAYKNGEDYSNIEQYNNLADQYNSFGNQFGQAMGGVGKVLSAIPNPWTQAIGAGLQMGSGFMTTDVDRAMNSIGATASKNDGTGGWAESVATGLAGTDWSKMGTVFGNAGAKIKAGVKNVFNKNNNISYSADDGHVYAYNKNAPGLKIRI